MNLKVFARISFLTCTISFLITITCTKANKKPSSIKQLSDPRWKTSVDYCRSLHPGRPHKIEVMAGIYCPGTQPQGIGEKLRQFRVIADEYEALHPDVTIEFLIQAVLSGGAEGEFIRTQLLGGVAPEIVSINTEAMWPDVEQRKGWWVPLDSFLIKPNPYVNGNKHWIDIFRNKALTQAKRAMDGKLYCITYDIVETGIFYNKEILRQLNLSLPETWQEFLQMQAKIRDAGYIPLVIATYMERDWGLDLIFDQCYYEILDLIDYKKKSDIEETYYQGYLTPEELCWLIEKNWFAPKNPR